ncbi:MAG: FAD-dependent oxidoreductase [Flavobacteriales bacterium]
MRSDEERMVIVGAGLVGSLWALMLANRGCSVDVYERRPDPRKGPVAGGRSINLALSDRGWRALERAGIANEVRKIAMPIEGRLMHAVDGQLTFQRYGLEGKAGVFPTDPQCIYSISRANLNKLLVEAAESHHDVEVHFNHRCIDIDLRKGDTEVPLTFEDAHGQPTHVQASRVFGTDGAFSAVRDRMMRTDRFDFEQRYLEHGYREVEMQPDAKGEFRMRPDCLHIWPRGQFMLMALPNPDRTFTCTLFAPYDGPEGLNAIEDAPDARAYFERHFPDVMPLLPKFDEDWKRHPTSSLVMTRCYPWNIGERVALMGDAAHAIVPFYGQGMNSGMEDCFVLDELMTRHGSDWASCFAEYTALRKPAGDAILELALRNYIEMRDKTGDERFLLQKKIEARLAQRYPGRWLPLYSQVTFSHTPYHEALAAGRRQDEIMAEVMNRPDIRDVWDSDEVAEAAIQRLESAHRA